MTMIWRTKIFKQKKTTVTSFKINKQSQPIIFQKHLICIYAQKSRPQSVNNYPSQKSAPAKTVPFMNGPIPSIPPPKDDHSNRHRSEFHFGSEATRNTREKKTVYYIRMRTWRNRNWPLAKRVCKKTRETALSQRVPVRPSPGRRLRTGSTRRTVKTDTQNAIIRYPIPRFVMGKPNAC